MSVSGIKKHTLLNDVKIAFIADDIKNISEFGVFYNATFSLMLAAQELNIKILLAESNNLKIVKNKIVAKFDEVILKREVGNHLKIKSSNEYSLDSFNVVFARKDPPIDENFIAYIQMLSMVSSKTLIVNNPEGILKANDKLFTLNFPKFTPPTIVTSHTAEILTFLSEYKEVVIKPIFDKGGNGVFYLNQEVKKNVHSIIELSTKNEHRTVLVQKFIPEIVKGDKRIVLLNGNPIGSVIRVPKAGESIASIDRGANVLPGELSKRNLEICEALKLPLMEKGLYFAAIDVIGDYLTEINVSCPAGIQPIENLTGKPIAKEIIKWAVEKALSNERSTVEAR